MVRKYRRITIESVAAGLLEAHRVTKGGASWTRPPAYRLGKQAGVRVTSYAHGKPMHRFVSRAVDVVFDLREADPSPPDQLFILYWDGMGYRIRPFGATETFRLAEPDLRDGGIWVARGNAIQPSNRFSPAAIEMLEALINGAAPESDFQEFFEGHPEFMLTLGNYSAIHPQLVLQANSARLVPDFFLERLDSNFADVCDLKRADVDLVRRQRNRVRFRDAVMEAVAQLDTYRDWFEREDHRSAFAERYGLESFRPQVVMIIGRRASFDSEFERVKLEANLPRWVSLATYDDVLGRALQWKGLASAIKDRTEHD